jgi:hypothetical protein
MILQQHRLDIQNEFSFIYLLTLQSYKKYNND